MTITDYRKKHGLTTEQMADRCGIIRSTLAMIETGGGCRLVTAKKIVDGTNGEVPFADLLVDPAAQHSEEPKAEPDPVA
jgi:hypothetical protein